MKDIEEIGKTVGEINEIASAIAAATTIAPARRASFIIIDLLINRISLYPAFVGYAGKRYQGFIAAHNEMLRCAVKSEMHVAI